METTTDTAESATQTLAAMDVRIGIVEAALRVLSRQSYRRTTLRDVADEAGMTLEQVGEHFPTWPGLVMATLHHWQTLRTAHLLDVGRDHGVLEFMRRLVEENLDDPVMARLLVMVLAEAMDPTHPSAPYLQTRYEAFHQTILTAVEHDIAMGRLPHDLQADHAAELILGLWEGLWMQFLLRPQMDMQAAFDRALGVLVRDWRVV
ncbi:helix-turn-helix domain-containing protein [Curtobacterium sp. MCBD17_035]|uniref:TetR/AcrR family transcriptional regulator n=1 Tax=Curtobacterium sp. MCBD17_035 TaxID=2175673 RepID=UPI000DA72767|nr:helix-turn-helix domain-containing protein [Curtobacterium sp. MCBD17_035]WIB67259.1 helix-turn-helix domain-containing protein [Curtobacterium sp. MCBD17_035]